MTQREKIIDHRPFKERLHEDLHTQTQQIKKHRSHYLFMLPFTLLFILFYILPVCISIFFSFTSFNMLEMPRWVGIANYFKLFVHDDIFITAIKNTLVFAAITGPVGYLFCLLVAWLLNELKHGLRVLFTILFYMPTLSGGMYVIWQTMFSGDAFGYINGVLIRLGLINNPILWLTNTKYMTGIVMIVILWQSLGTTFLSFIAGLQGIDRQYYEAAAIDGIHNRWQELWFITLPLMKPQLLFGAVISITQSFNIGDAITALVGFPSTDYKVHTIMNHLNDYGTIRFEMGYASAIATLLFLLMVFSNKAVQKLLSKVGT